MFYVLCLYLLYLFVCLFCRPPGTGKTLLAKAVASLTSSTFINCTSSTILCKYRGDSEKTIKCLFDTARLLAPSIIFIDEIDGLTGGSRQGGSNEHEATRRLKTEFFTQMDGLISHSSITSVFSNSNSNSNSNPSNANGNGNHISNIGASNSDVDQTSNTKSNTILVLATTNAPWDLDEALRRRFEKRIYIPLPDLKARQDIFCLYLNQMKCSVDVEILLELSQLTEGYSGADIHNICKETSMIPLRKMMILHPNPIEMQKLYQQGNLQLPKVGYTVYIFCK